MSLLRRSASLTDLLAERTAGRAASGRVVSAQAALRHSAVWACRRLRADLISTMPLDVFRRVSGVQVEMPKPPVLVNPGGEKVDIQEWLYSTQFDLDGVGNDFGIITERDGNGIASRIDLVPVEESVVQVRKGVITYRLAGTVYQPDQVWHERQFTTSGSPVGLSPLAYAAMSLSGYLSAQDFAQEWFSGGTIPKAHLKNNAKKVGAQEADALKKRFESQMTNGGLFVSGNDWDYNMISAKASESAVIDTLKFGIGDAARFFGVPGDMIDAETSSGAVTYANVTQRNLQLLIMNIGPAVARRERALSRLTPGPRYVKLNTDALLRMDLKSRYEAHQVAIDGRFLAPSEVRELENRQPFTPEQEAEFDRLFPSRAATPAKTGAPA